MKIITVLLAACFVLAATTPAHADPVSALVSLVTAISSIGAVGQLLIGVALQVGMSLMARAKAKKNQPQESGVKGSLRTGGDNPLSFIVGTYATAGSLEYVGTWGKAGKTPNAYLTQVISLSDLPIAGMSNLVWISGQECTIDWEAEPVAQGYPVLEYRVDGTDHLWVLFFDGSQTTSSEFLLNSFNDGDRPWLDDMIGRGVAYAAVTARVNREILTSGPSCKFVLQGIKLYDVRKDSTAGGTGPHRWGTPSTYEFSDNPKVVHYNIKRGIYYDGEWVYGGQGMSAFQLPASNWMAAMNECDRQIALAGGATEKQFRCGGEITVDYQPIEACKELDKSCNGRTAELGGIYKTICGAPGLPVYSFTDDDIVISEPQTFDQYPGLEDTYNGVNATYPEPAEAWTTKDAPPRYNSGYEAADSGNRLLADIAYPLVPYSNQVQRLTYAMLEEERRFRKHNGTLSPEAWLIEPLDVVSWTSARNGYVAKSFLMGAMDDLANVNQAVAFRELDPNDYDWSSDFELPTSVGPLGPVEPAASTIDGWSAEPWRIEDGDGHFRRPAIKVHAAADLDDVRAIRIVARVKMTGTIVFDSAAYAYASPHEWVLSGPWCLPANIYQVKGIEVPYSGRKVEWSEWIDVLTDDIRISPDDLVQEIRDRLDTLDEWIDDDLLNKVNQTIIDLSAAVAQIDQEEQERIDGAIEAADRFRGLLDQIESIRDYVANADYAGYTAREEIRRTITARLETSIASFDERITTAVSETAAISERITTFEAEVDDLGAQIITVDTARADGDSALAQQITLLSAGTDNQFDPAKLWGFDSTVESWTGNGTPTVASGFLRPANHASDPYVTSPTDLNIVANAYTQVRARVRKTGTLTWDGRAWWRQASDATWDTGRSATVSEPSFDANGIGLITFNMAWSGTIDRIRLDLSTVQDATNYYTIDWISIGSPSPGASRAELLAERTARIDGDSALASDIVALQAEITDPVSGLTALAGGVSALEASVDTLDDTVTAHSTALTGINAELIEKADVDVVAELQAEVEALGGGGIVSQGSAVTAIRNSLLPLAGEVADQEFANFLSRMDGLKVTAEASNSLDTKITLMGDSLDIVSQAVTRVQAVIPGLATATALEAITSRVTATESSITAQASSINSINVALPLKANTSDVNTALATKASASGLTALTARVTQTEDDIDSQADAITAINASLGTKAAASALTALTTRVTAAEDGLATKASASSVTSLSATVGDVTADYRQKAEVVAGPSGYVRVGTRLRYGTTGDYKSAGFYFDVPANPALDTLCVVNADQFAFVSGSSRLVPFRIDDGVVYIDDLKVGTHNIDAGAVFVVEGNSGSGSVAVGSDRVVNVTIVHGNRELIPGLKVKVTASAAYWSSISNDDGSGGQPGSATLRNVTDDETIAFARMPLESTGSAYANSFSYSYLFTPPTGRTATQFRLTVKGRGTVEDMNVIAEAFKAT